VVAISLVLLRIQVNWGGSNKLHLDSECHPRRRHLSKRDTSTQDPYKCVFCKLIKEDVHLDITLRVTFILIIEFRELILPI
jgi:hypothetical protein